MVRANRPVWHRKHILTRRGSLTLSMGRSRLLVYWGCFLDHNVNNHRLPLSGQRLAVARCHGDERQFHPLHDRFETAQCMAANHQLARDESHVQRQEDQDCHYETDSRRSAVITSW